MKLTLVGLLNSLSLLFGAIDHSSPIVPSSSPAVINTDTLFFEDFEERNLNPVYWSNESGSDGGMVLVADSIWNFPIVHTGTFAAAIGCVFDGNFTVNSLDLRLNLAS